MTRPVSQAVRRFLENLRDALRSADSRSLPTLVFVRCVEEGFQDDVCAAIETAFAKIPWTHYDLRTRSAWEQLRANAPQPGRGVRGSLLHHLPVRADGTVEPGAVDQIGRYTRWLARKGHMAIFVVTPWEVSGLMDRAMELWSRRAGYLSWPERSRPLADAAPEADPEARPEAPTPPRAEAASGPIPRPDSGSVREKIRELRAGPLEAADAGEVLLAAATLFQSGYFEHASGHAVRALTSFQAANDRRGAAETQHLLGLIAERQRDLASALEWFEKALSTYERARGCELQRAMVLERVGAIHYSRGATDLALTYFRRTLEIDEQREDEPRMAAGYRRLAALLARGENLDKAEEFIRRALDLEKSQENKSGEARCYLHLGRITARQNRYTEASEQLRTALELCEELEDDAGRSVVLHELGNLELSQGLYPEALRSYDKALELDRARGNAQGVARGHAQIGHAFAEAGKADKALSHLLRAHRSAGLLGIGLAKEIMAKIESLRAHVDRSTYQLLLAEAQAEELVAPPPPGARVSAPLQSATATGPATVSAQPSAPSFAAPPDDRQMEEIPLLEMLGSTLDDDDDDDDDDPEATRKV